jgi:hypothetical protein
VADEPTAPKTRWIDLLAPSRPDPERRLDLLAPSRPTPTDPVATAATPSTSSMALEARHGRCARIEHEGVRMLRSPSKSPLSYAGLIITLAAAPAMAGQASAAAPAIAEQAPATAAAMAGLAPATAATAGEIAVEAPATAATSGEIAVEAPAMAELAATTPSTPDPVADKLEDVAGRVEAMQEPLAGLQEDVKKLKGLKLSGYVQLRLNLNDASKNGVKDDGKTPANLDQFEVRRARLKATYTGVKHSEVVVQIDATGKGVVLKDAYAAVTEPWTPLGLTITAGQMNMPFGYEIALSSSSRETMERSQVFRALFPGERDRGVKLSTNYKFLRADLGLFNGNGTEDTSTVTTADTSKDANNDGVIDESERSSKIISTLNFGGTDRDAHKDFIGRIGVDFGYVSGGISAYVGKWGRIDTPLTATGTTTTGATTYSGGDQVTYLDKQRYGADIQLFRELFPGLGGTSLRAEYIMGHGVFDKDKQEDTDVRGWYLTLVQTLGRHWAVAARVDQFDPNTASDQDETLQLEPVVLFYPTSAIKISGSYQIVRDFAGTDEAGNRIDKANNQFSLQFQGKF